MADGSPRGPGGGGGKEDEGRRLLVDGRFADALALYERALAGRPGDPDLLNGKGAALRSLGRYDEANECYEASLRADPRDRSSS